MSNTDNVESLERASTIYQSLRALVTELSKRP